MRLSSFEEVSEFMSDNVEARGGSPLNEGETSGQQGDRKNWYKS